MPIDYDRLRPDFEAEMRLPEWLQMGGDQQQQSPDISPFVGALKKRIMKPPEGGNLGASMSGMVKPKSGGGMRSL